MGGTESLLVSVRILSKLSAVTLLGFKSISTNFMRKTSYCCDSNESLSAARDNVSATCSSFRLFVSYFELVV